MEKVEPVLLTPQQPPLTIRERNFPTIKEMRHYPIYPNTEAKEELNKTFGHCVFIWNRGLEHIIRSICSNEELDKFDAIKATNGVSSYIEALKAKVQSLNNLKKSDPNGFKELIPIIHNVLKGLFRFLTTLKHNNQFLYSVSAIPEQQTINMLMDAINRYLYGDNNFPKFKKPDNIFAIRYTSSNGGFFVKDGHLHIAKMFHIPIRIKWTRPLPDIRPPKSLVVTRNRGKYFISFVVDVRCDRECGKGAIGIDLGVNHLIVTSDGEKVDNSKNLKKVSKRIKHLQKSQARSRKEFRKRYPNEEFRPGSNYNKRNDKIAKCYQKAKNQTLDYCHKVANNLVKTREFIVIEDINKKNLMRNHRLAGSIQASAWGILERVLIHKALRTKNCTVIQIPRFVPTSKMCSVTGEIAVDKLPLNKREWQCPKCNQIHDRDVNAAKNILNVALNTINEMGIPLEELQKVSGFIKIHTKTIKVPTAECEKTFKFHKLLADGNNGKIITIYGHENHKLILGENLYIPIS